MSHLQLVFSEKTPFFNVAPTWLWTQDIFGIFLLNPCDLAFRLFLSLKNHRWFFLVDRRWSICAIGSKLALFCVFFRVWLMKPSPQGFIGPHYKDFLLKVGWVYPQYKDFRPWHILCFGMRSFGARRWTTARSVKKSVDKEIHPRMDMLNDDVMAYLV